MAINKKLIVQEAAAELEIEGLTLHLDANDVDSYDGDGDIWYDIHDFPGSTTETSLISDTNLELHLDADSFPEKGEAGYSNTPTTWTDSSSNSNNGTITGATFDSELGNWLEYTGGSSKVVISDGGALTNVGTFTVEMWGKVEDNNAYRYLWSNFDSANGKRQVFCYIDNSDRIEVGLYYGNGSTDYKLYRTNSVASKVNNKWKHYVFKIVSGAVDKIYIDGEEEAITYTTGSGTMHTTSTSNFNVGSANQSTNLSFNGEIGQFRVYSSALTAEQITQNYDFTKGSYPNGYNGDISGADWHSDGYFDFSGVSEYITVNATATTPINFSADFSVAAWVNPDVLGSTRQIVTKYGTTDATKAFILGILSDGKVSATLRSGSSNINTLTSAGVVTTSGGWYHIALVRDGSAIKIYVNGTLSTTGSSSSTMNKGGSQPIRIGAQSTGTTNEFDGQISKVRMYDKALTQAEIDALYAEGE